MHRAGAGRTYVRLDQQSSKRANRHRQPQSWGARPTPQGNHLTGRRIDASESCPRRRLKTWHPRPFCPDANLSAKKNRSVGTLM